MKVGIYSELHEGNSLGGREFVVAVIAEWCYAHGYVAEFVHHMPGLTATRFGQQFGITRGVPRLRYMPTRPPARMRNYRRRARERLAWEREISARYDCFITIVHEAPVRCYARHGILIVLFPFHDPTSIWAGQQVPVYGRSRLWVLARYLRGRLRWRQIMESYRLAGSISLYVQRWTERRWSLPTKVIYPPSETDFTETKKENLILSVGRFSGAQPQKVNKQQLEMMQAFARLPNECSRWRYVTAGAVGEVAPEREYFRTVGELAEAMDGRAEAIADVLREELLRFYGSAKIFWHAAGLGNDEEKTPELSEHYGIATVDAMMAGCVPVVIRKGAQPEIVEHGISGFLCDTLDDFVRFTSQLAIDDALWAQMSRAARERAKLFSREAFVESFSYWVSSLLPMN